MIDIAARIRELPAYAQLATQLELLAGELAESIIRERLQSLLTPTSVRDGLAARSSRATVSEPAVVAKQGSTSRKPMSCSKCGAAGFTATTCGKTHNVSTSPAVASVASRGRGNPVSPPATSSLHVKPQAPPISRPDRFTRIQTAATARIAADLRPRRGSTRGVSRPVVTDDVSQVLTDEQQAGLRARPLPTPRSTTIF